METRDIRKRPGSARSSEPQSVTDRDTERKKVEGETGTRSRGREIETDIYSYRKSLLAKETQRDWETEKLSGRDWSK